MRRRLFALLGAALVLSGCASFNRLDNDVSTYGAWPADRKPTSYAFEHLPSQEAKPEEQKQQQRLEDAARGAMQQAGFTEAGSPQDADTIVQLGARIYSDTPWVYNDPLFWRGGLRWGGYRYGRGWGFGRGFGPAWGFGPYDYPASFGREVALVIRDRRSGEVLYEARADNAGPSASIDGLLPAMFSAAMHGFPTVSPTPRKVTVEIDRTKG